MSMEDLTKENEKAERIKIVAKAIFDQKSWLITAYQIAETFRRLGYPEPSVDDEFAVMQRLIAMEQGYSKRLGKG